MGKYWEFLKECLILEKHIAEFAIRGQAVLRMSKVGYKQAVHAAAGA